MAAKKKMPAKKTAAKKKSSDTYVDVGSESPNMRKMSAKDRSENEISSLKNAIGGPNDYRSTQRRNSYGNVFTAITGKKATTKNVDKANPVQRAAIEAILRRAETSAGNRGLSASYARSKTGKESAAQMKSARANAKRAAKKK